MTQEEKLKEALKLAGKMSQAATKVLNSTVSKLSWNVAELEMARNDYDAFIFEHLLKEENDN